MVYNMKTRGITKLDYVSKIESVGDNYNTIIIINS